MQDNLNLSAFLPTLLARVSGSTIGINPGAVAHPNRARGPGVPPIRGYQSYFECIQELCTASLNQLFF